MMHYWGDGFDFDTFNEAVVEIERRLRSYRITVFAKEKYGTLRLEYLALWDGRLEKVFYPQTLRIRWGWFYRIDTLIARFNHAIGLVKLVQWLQWRGYNKSFEIVISKYPQFVDELSFGRQT